MVMSSTKLAVPDRDRNVARDAASEIGRIAVSGGEILVRDESGRQRAFALTTPLVEAISAVFARLGDSADVLLLGEEEELSPEQAARVLGISRPLVYHRMKTGRLAFRQVGSHRRVKLKDVLALAGFEERRASFSRDLGADTDDQELAHRGT